MLLILAFRQLLVRRMRSLFLLLGYSLGVGVMIVLLSVGEAMLEQARDVSLVGGGEVTVLPEGIDVEALRTGGLSGMFFTIDRARYVVRQVLGGPRQAGAVAAVSPSIDGKLLYLVRGGDTIAVRAGGEIPSRANAVGAGLAVREGSWKDDERDSSYIAPTLQQLYDEIDHFHFPPVRDSTWGEWHYFNVVTGPEEWWYISLLVGGEVPAGRWGGQILVTHRRRDGKYERFDEAVPATAISLDTARADLTLGPSFVQQRDGQYLVRVQLPRQGLDLDLTLQPAAHRYFPPLQLREGEYLSGYAVAALTGRATLRACAAGVCRTDSAATGYHDHNWGVWRDVTWEWGAASGPHFSFLYGQVQAPDSGTTSQPFFFSLVDSLGIRQVFRSQRIRYEGEQDLVHGSGVSAPASFVFDAVRERDSIRVRVEVKEAIATRMGAAGTQRYFLQMRGAFRLGGEIAGESVREEGAGFFETWLQP